MVAVWTIDEPDFHGLGYSRPGRRPYRPGSEEFVVRRIWRVCLVAGVVATLTVMAPSAGVAAAPPPPPAPTGLVLEYTGALSWQQPPGTRARSFRVYENGAVVARNTTTSFGFGNVGYAGYRYFTVTAVDSRGQESPHSVMVSGSVGLSGVPPQCQPGYPIREVTTRVTASTATLEWTDPSNVGPVTVTGGPAGPVSSRYAGVHIGGLSPATSYTFALSRYSNCSGPPPPPTTVTVVTAPGAAVARPEPPVAPSVAAQGDTWLRLAWQPPAGATEAARYAVYQGARRVATTSGTSVTVRGLYHAAGYAFTVVAVDARGNESAGAAVSGSTATCQSRPPRPIDVTARALSASSVRLDWVQEAAASSYTIYEGDTVVGTSVGTATVVSGLPSASAHRFRVVANLIRGCGSTRASAAAAVETPAGPTARPARPDGLRMTTGDPRTGTVWLRWTQPTDGAPAVAYRLYVGTEVVATSATTGVAVQLPMATRQVLTVVAVSADGMESAQSAPLSVLVPYLPPP